MKPSALLNRICPAKAVGVLALFILIQPATAQTAARDDSELLKQLLKRVEELEAEVKGLKAKQAATPIPVATATEAAKQSAVEPPQGAHPSHEGLPVGAPSLKIQGFADVMYRVSDLKGERSSFAVGQIDLFITSRLSSKVDVLAELVLEANDENEFHFEAERLLIKYAHNDYFNIAAGRYHTAIGYYNTAYHHGTWFQTATGRPFIFEFEDEGGILPIHNVGLTASGRIPSGRLGLKYVAEIGNGRQSRRPLGEPQSAVDENNRKAFNFALMARPDWAHGFQTGLSIYRDRLQPEGRPRIGETILAVHAIYEKPTFEFLNEAVIIRHAPDGSGPEFNTLGFYSQVSREFGKARPYFRYQYVNAPGSDPVLGHVGRMNGPSLGLRYDVGEFAAFKVQYDRTARRAKSAFNALGLQFAFTF